MGCAHWCRSFPIQIQSIVHVEVLARSPGERWYTSAVGRRAGTAGNFRQFWCLFVVEIFAAHSSSRMRCDRIHRSELVYCVRAKKRMVAHIVLEFIRFTSLFCGKCRRNDDLIVSHRRVYRTFACMCACELLPVLNKTGKFVHFCLFSFGSKVIIVFIAYIGCVTYYWKWENSFIFGLLGQTFWLGMIFYGCSFFGPLQIPALFVAFGYIGIASVYYSKYYSGVDEAPDDGDNKAHRDSLGFLDTCAKYWRPRSTSNILENESPSNDVHNASIVSDGDESSSECGSDVYFKALFIACLVIIFYKQLLMIFLAFIPIGVYLCNKLIEQFGIREYAAGRIDEVTTFVQVGEASIQIR